MNTLTQRPDVERRPVESRIDSATQPRRVDVWPVAAVVASVLCIVLPVLWNVFVYPLFFKDYLQARQSGIWGNGWNSEPWLTSLCLCIAVSVVLGLAGIVLAVWRLRSTHRMHGAVREEPGRGTG